MSRARGRLASSETMTRGVPGRSRYRLRLKKKYGHPASVALKLSSHRSIPQAGMHEADDRLPARLEVPVDDERWFVAFAGLHFLIRDRVVAPSDMRFRLDGGDRGRPLHVLAPREKQRVARRTAALTDGWKPSRELLGRCERAPHRVARRVELDLQCDATRRAFLGHGQPLMWFPTWWARENGELWQRAAPRDARRRGR